jgi:phage anti-repressor protein
MGNHALIPVFAGTIQDRPAQLVDARVLHTFLEVARDFSTWLKKRIADYGFIKDQDYIQIDSPVLGNQTGRGGDRRSIDYHLTLDMAKELSMVERNEKGRQARRYFIECEQQLLEQRPVTHPEEFTLPLNARLLVTLEQGRMVHAEVIGPEHYVVYRTIQDKGVKLVNPASGESVILFFRNHVHGETLAQVVLDGVTRLSYLASNPR